MGISISELFVLREPGYQAGNGWFKLPLSVRVHMSLSLSDPMTLEIPCVLGFLQGSDIAIANELVVIAVNYDSFGTDPNGQNFAGSNHNASGIGILLEVMRLWQEQQIDTRRSVLVIAWGGGYLGNPGIDSFLEDDTSFRHLPAQSGPRSLSPEVVIQFSGVGAGDDVLLIHPESSPRLKSYIEDKANELKIPFSDQNHISIPTEFFVPGLSPNWVYFTWADSTIPLDQDMIENVLPEKLEITGEILSYLLIELVRQTQY